MTAPRPELTPLNTPYWQGLKEGRLMVQHCTHCGHCWLPAREACPRCLAAGPVWRASNGRGKVVSWVIYHTAYHESFAERLPYEVALIELEEGPRLLTNVVNSERGRLLRIDAPVELSIEDREDFALACFKLTGAYNEAGEKPA